ncbi:hypothetical protein HYX11_01670 [Candidatus Woesearchaeota archaeon]|nr:hypothetical protein [Candidatus Woesearchaeota archaeon]
MLELNLPETGTVPYPYNSEDFHYELLLNLEVIGLASGSGEKIRFSMNLTNPTNPHPIADVREHFLPKSILQEEGYKRAEARECKSAHIESFVNNYVTKTLAGIIAHSVRQENGRLLLSGRENRSNSYYAHRDIYVLPAISGVGTVDIRAGTCPGLFVRSFCSDEIDTARRERMKERVISQFVKSS